ncbi:Oxidoreductase ptaL [Lachnellula arida]|uniref:Oxidoreductase ptaL n=1 Tax=Lachnellula arida TaxID=1316785 RepID=A0A8T9BAQ3_9HELO|nr:Oxidoreductase ptaL [Lachnellula arida]
MHNIVILGGNFAGVGAAHYILRHVFPSLNSSEKAQYKVTLISPSDHTFFKIGAPRALVSNKLIPLDKPFASIPDAFSGYKTSEFTFVYGKAVGVDEESKTVSVDSASAKTSVQYDLLVIATGTTSSPLWTLNDDYTLTRAAFEDLHRRIPRAEKILIAGGGAAGVETAGEIAHLHKGKNITILSGSLRLLPRLKNVKAGTAAERQLEAQGVKTIHNIKVTSSTTLPDGKTSLLLSDDNTEIVDVYIDATGGTPNTSFLPDHWLDENKRVATETSTLRATKAPAGIYSIGDVASYSKGSAMDSSWPIPALGYSIWSDLVKSANDDGLHVGNPILKEKKYKQIEADMQIVPIGPMGGVGVIFGWTVPSWSAGLATGAQFVKP